MKAHDAASADSLMRENATLRAQLLACAGANTALAQLSAAYAVALLWYADSDNYDLFGAPGTMDHQANRREADRGAMAREALEGKETAD